MKKKRLRRRIFWSICLVAFTVLSISLIIIVAALNSYFTAGQKEQLKNETILAARGVDTEGLNFFDGITSESLYAGYEEESSLDVAEDYVAESIEQSCDEPEEGGGLQSSGSFAAADGVTATDIAAATGDTTASEDIAAAVSETIITYRAAATGDTTATDMVVAAGGVKTTDRAEEVDDTTTTDIVAATGDITASEDIVAAADDTTTADIVAAANDTTVSDTNLAVGGTTTNAIISTAGTTTTNEITAAADTTTSAESQQKYKDGNDSAPIVTLDDFRITWIAPDGTVLYDNYASDYTRMNNHLSRPEVADAIKYGYGESIRKSGTMLYSMLYAAVRLEDGSILRLSYMEESIWALILKLLPLIAAVAAVAAVMSLYLAYKVTANVIGPINSIDLDDPMKNDTYEEIEPLMKRIDQQQRELRADRAALERNEKIREEFTANVSHELKTPLQTISGYAEIIQAGIVKKEDLKPFAGKIYQESRRLTTLVEDIINLTGLDGSEGGKSLRPMDIYSVAENVVDSLYNTAETEGIELKLRGSSMEIYSDSELLHSIIYNLCDNAIKYNHPGGIVQVDIRRGNGCAVLKVIDNGIGIPEESVDRIFERFYRVDKSRSKEVGGTGLGLSIVKHTVMILGASISVKSELGKGTVFTVKFPL